MVLKDFIRYWMDMAESIHNSTDEKINTLTRFVCYYIAFNHAFDEHNKKHKRYERTKIIILIIDTMKCFKNMKITFNPFLVLREDSELFKSVKSELYNYKNNEDNNVVYNSLSYKNIKKLFNNIYQVRCNLFHGAKDMITYRNEELVEDSVKVLKYFLEAYLNLI